MSSRGLVMCLLLKLKWVYFVDSLVTGKQKTNTTMKHELRLSVTIIKAKESMHVYEKCMST